MITTPTVFILGAGASKPYGFPTGDELTKKILDRTDMNNAQNSDLVNVMDAANFDPASLNSFKVRLKNSEQTIDEFILRNERFSNLAKFLISEIILKSASQKPSEDHDWYRYFWRKISTGLSFDELSNHRLTIISFNYDRSLEKYLTRVSKGLYPEVSNTPKQIIDKIPIIHIHGVVGEHHDPNNIDPLAVLESSQEIGFVHENYSGENLSFQKAIEHARRIYFLGFGYNQSNLEKIGINYLADPSREVGGTTMGLGDREIQTIKALTNNHMEIDGRYRVTVFDYIKHYVKFSG